MRLIGRGIFGAVYEVQRNVFDDVEKAVLKVISIPQNSSDIDEMYGMAMMAKVSPVHLEPFDEYRCGIFLDVKNER